MFYLGLAVGVVLTTVVAFLLKRRRAAKLVKLEQVRSAQFRRITELERQLAQARAGSGKASRELRQRADREFSQYKVLLRRADKALAQARAERDSFNRAA